MNRRQLLLLGLGAVSGASTLGLGQWLHHRATRAQQARDRTFPVTGTQPLWQRAAAKGITFGASATRREILEDPDLAQRFVEDCRMLVPANELKWKTIRPSATEYQFEVPDAMLAFAQQHGLIMHGHTLVWHNSLPDWFAETVNASNAEQILVDHVQTVATHYAGQIRSWDVVNEAILPEHDQPNGLRKTPWLEFLGEDYLDLAFRVAHGADPQALLLYNDFNLDFAVRQDERKRRAVLGLLERLTAKGVPIHALGIQGHLSGAQVPHFDAEVMRRFLRDVASLGLKIFITELDVIDKAFPADLSIRDRMVAAAYEDYLSVVLEEPAVVSVATWGFSDRYTWLNSFHPREDELPVRPLPLDENLQPKLAWNAIARAFDQAPPRDPNRGETQQE